MVKFFIRHIQQHNGQAHQQRYVCPPARAIASTSCLPCASRHCDLCNRGIHVIDRGPGARFLFLSCTTLAWRQGNPDYAIRVLIGSEAFETDEPTALAIGSLPGTVVATLASMVSCV